MYNIYVKVICLNCEVKNKVDANVSSFERVLRSSGRRLENFKPEYFRSSFVAA